MAVSIEHDERRKVILEKALTVFVDDGYEHATFQKIADRCGITRTILYLYFKNKREIFFYSIKQLLLNIEETINSIRADKSLNYTDKLLKVLLNIFELLEQNRQFLSITFNYLLYISKSQTNPETRVKRRTVKLRHMLSSLIIDGIKKGEFKKMNIKTANDFLYSFIESAIFQLVFSKRSNLDELKETVAFAVRQLAN